MRENLEKSLKFVFGDEGGYVNDPQDPGGPTKFGITARTLGAWRKLGHPATASEVQTMEISEATAVIKEQYADKVSFDRLPSGLDLAVLDYAVNSGPAQAGKALQRMLATEQDGVIGLHTVEALRNHAPGPMIVGYCNARLEFMRGLHTWDRFGKGWTRRVNRVKERALAMNAVAAGVTAPKPPFESVRTEPVPQARPADKMGWVEAVVNFFKGQKP